MLHKATSEVENLPAIIIADDHAIVRRGVRYILESRKLPYSIKETAECSTILQILRTTKVKAAILDIHLLDGNVISILPVISKLYPDIPVLIYSVVADEIYARRLLQLGIHGFVNKKSPLEELEKAILKILDGQYYISEPFQSLLIQSISQKTISANPLEALSDRELQIVNFLINNLTLPVIAKKMGLTSSSVHTYKQRAFEKLKIQTTLQLKDIFELYEGRVKAS